MPLKAGMAVDSLGQNKINTKTVYERNEYKYLIVLWTLSDFLSKQNLPFRGQVEMIKPHDTSNKSGNFIELTKLLSNYDPVLREYVWCQNLTHGQ